jgi:hypothetical protein
VEGGSTAPEAALATATDAVLHREDRDRQHIRNFTEGSCRISIVCTERLTRLAIIKENRADDVVVAIIDSFFFFSPVIALPADRARRAQRG